MPTSISHLTSARHETPTHDEFPIASTPLGKINELASGLPDLSLPRGLLGQRPADQPASMGYVRNVLLLESTPAHLRDEVWRAIGTTARRERHGWNLFALGVAYPGLRARARRLTPPPTPFQLVAEVHFDLAAEFLLALHRLRLDRPNVISRLLGAAYDQASGRKRNQNHRTVDIDAIDPLQAENALARDQPAPDHTPTGPHEVLRALAARTNTAAGPLTDLHTSLIGRTYLDGQRLTTVAADLGISLPTASKRRRAAAVTIAVLLGRPDLAAHLTPPP